MTVLVVGKNNYAGNLDLALTARAMGASEITFTSRKDSKLVRHIADIGKKWGGRFKVSFSSNYKNAIRAASRYQKVYLTRYGIPLTKLNYPLRTYKNIMLIVTTKEPLEQIDKISNFNVSITDQPHCSAAAIAVFLHSFYEGRELAMRFENAKLKITPQEHGMRVDKAK